MVSETCPEFTRWVGLSPDSLKTFRAKGKFVRLRPPYIEVYERADENEWNLVWEEHIPTYTERVFREVRLENIDVDEMMYNLDDVVDAVEESYS